jgi:large subunit ribosomal protein L31
MSKITALIIELIVTDRLFFPVDRLLTDVYNENLMKQGLHPDNYRLVVFEDLNNGFRFLTRSTATAEDTTKWEDGQEYPLIKVHITSASHPFFTGEERVLDIEGRVDKFKNRAAAGQAAKDRRAAAAKKASSRQAAKVAKAETKAENAKPSK